jgi:hypothetical protein
VTSGGDGDAPALAGFAQQLEHLDHHIGQGHGVAFFLVRSR